METHWDLEDATLVWQGRLQCLVFRMPSFHEFSTHHDDGVLHEVHGLVRSVDTMSKHLNSLNGTTGISCVALPSSMHPTQCLSICM